MTTIEEQLQRTFIIGTTIATASLAVGLISLYRSSPLGQRVTYENSHCLVAVRGPGEWYKIQDFIQPGNPDVIARYSQIGPDAWGCLDWVCRNISYRRDVGEFWLFPSEALATGEGDCEDSSILLTSLLNCFTSAYVALGSYGGLGHAWVVNEEGEILESTYTAARRVPDPQNYIAHALFNHSEAYEFWPGALQEVFELGRNESLKLQLMAED